MGITIDESIENLVLLKKLEDSLGNISANTNSVVSQSLECAVDTMRKYQKIEQILKSLDDGEINYPQMTYYLREVLEDGNNNQNRK